jgi:mono/diheme cytochrome c family protein
MKMKIRLVGGVMLTAISVVLFGSCVSDKDSSGLEYMPDMYRSPAIEPYVDYGQIQGREDAELTMQQSAMTPPHGTIPYYGTNAEEVSMMLPWEILPNAVFAQTHGLKGFDFASAEEDTYENDAKSWNWNPLKMEVEAKRNGGNTDRKNLTLANAKKLYASNCMHCHGEKGDGNGPMMESGAYMGVPNYADKKDLSDGQLFYSIYYGKGMMGSHASQLNKKEIWSLVHYIRKFQDSDYDKEAMESVELKDGQKEVTKRVAVSAAPAVEADPEVETEDTNN